MGSIQTQIELYDAFSTPLTHIIQSVHQAVSAMADLQSGMNGQIDTGSLDAAREAADQAAMAMQELDRAMQGAGVETPAAMPGATVPEQIPQPAPVQPSGPADIPLPTPDPVKVPVQWEADRLDVFTETGIERFEQEVQSANGMLNSLNSTQKHIAQTAARTDIFPPGAVSDMEAMQGRLSAIQQRIRAIEGNPMNIGTDQANAELEQLRGQLDQALQQQESLNRAVQDMDVGAANRSYLELSQTVGGMEQNLRDNTTEQGRFNKAVQQGTGHANGLVNMVKRVAATYLTIQSAQKVIELSDEMSSVTARLDLMKDKYNTVEELQNKIYLSAQRSRASYTDTANAIARMGNNAGAAFSSNDELIAFMEQVNKQFAIGGANAQDQANAMLQLSQAMGAGALRGDELNSILEAAPGIARVIESEMGWAEGSIKSYAEEGKVSAQVVKNALLGAAEETNAKFENIPMTFSQIWTSFKNTALMAFQPVLKQISAFAASPQFQEFMNAAANALSVVAGIVVQAFEMIARVGAFISEHWSVIGPIIGVVAAVVAGLVTWLGILKIASVIAAGAAFLHAAATGAEATASMQAMAAQMGLNTAMLAFPLPWIILLIITASAAVLAFAAHIAHTGSVATTVFGVICGWINVVIQFFVNMGMTFASVASAIWAAAQAVAHNMKAAFQNAISGIQAMFYRLLSTACSVIGQIAAALNKLPFVHFDYSGITAAAGNFASKAAAAAGNKQDYVSISGAAGDAFNSKMGDTFKNGWVSDAYKSGAEWGDSVGGKISGKLSGMLKGVSTNIPNAGGYADLSNYGSDMGSAPADLGNIGKGVSDTAGNTGKIADSMEISEEDLKYLRDIAEQETVNRFTTAEIHIDQTNHNNISSKMDLDGVVTSLTDAVNEAVGIIAEGVHA